jgi:hypothetical protein
VGRAPRYLLLPGLLVGACFWLAFSNTALGDWGGDAAPAVAALAHGHLSAYLHAAPIMGPFATVVQAPFWLIGGDGLAGYQWAAFGCLLSAAGLGWYLAAVSGRRGAPPLFQLLLALLCVVNPLTWEALQMGHPEEILTAALAVGAVAVAVERRAVAAGILLGLAVVSKQWAVLAIFPVLMALPLPRTRIRCGAIGAALVAALSLPALIAAPSAFFETQGNAASGGRLATIWSAWYPLTHDTVRHLPGGISGTVHELPGPVQTATHSLIVALVVLLPLALWAWRGRFGLGGAEAMALLALLALLRCALDPVDNLYYHAPLLLALLGWDALSPGRLPLRGLAGAAIALLFWRWSEQLGSLELFNAAYVVVILAAALAIAATLLRREERPRRVLRGAGELAGT